MSRTVDKDNSPADWLTTRNREMNKERRDAEIAQVEDDWSDETDVFQGIPGEPTRRQSLKEINGQLANAFGSTESRSIELEPELWTEIDVEYVDPSEDTEVG